MIDIHAGRWAIALSVAASVLLAPAPNAARSGQQNQALRAGTDLVVIDVQVVTRDGDPVSDLQVADFDVQIGGSSRRVLHAELVRYVPSQAGAPPTPDRAGAALPPLAADPPAKPRRLYILAVDESSFSVLSVLAWREAIKRFIERLEPEDFAGLYAYPVGGPLVQLTQDHSAVLSGADKIVGRLDPPMLRYHMSLSEMADIRAGDKDVARRVAERECARSEIMWCTDFDVPREAQAFAMEVEARMSQSIGGLRTLMRSLRHLPERKTVLVISGGLFTTDRIGGLGARGDVSELISAVGQEANEANINLYVLHLDRNFIEMFSPRVRTLPSMLRDVELLGMGLDRFAGIAGGALIRVQAGSGDYAFERVLRETSAYYLVGVEPAPADRDGRPHHVTVKVKRGGTVVRNRAWVTVPKPRS